MSNDGVVRLRVVVEFDAVRARFDDELFIVLQVWDEIRHEYIQVCPVKELESQVDLSRPGEGFRDFWVELVE